MKRITAVILGSLVAALALGSFWAWADMSSVTDARLQAALHKDGATSVATEHFVAIQGDDGTNLQSIQTDTSGNLQVDVLTVPATGGATIVDDAPFTPATSSVSMGGALFDDSSPDSVNEGDGGAVRMSGNRNLYTTLRDSAGNERGATVNASSELNVADATAQASLSVIDDWDESNRMAANLIAGQVGIAAGSAAIGALTPSVTLATDDPAVVDLAAMEILQTSIEGDTTAIQAAVQIMDDWDDATSVDHAKTVPAQAVPQVPATVACDDTGAVAFTANAADNRLSIINTSTTLDVCVRFGATTGADRTTLTTCTFVLGAYSGAGTTEVYETPQGMRIGAESFACDSNGTANLAVTAWRNP